MDPLTGPPAFVREAEGDVLALQSYGTGAEAGTCVSTVSCISSPSAVPEEPCVSAVSRIWSPSAVRTAATDALA